MSDFTDKLEDVQAKLATLDERLQRHRNVVEGISESPDEYDTDAVDTYLSDLDQALEGADFLDAAEASLGPVEEATEAAAEALLADARVLVDDREIEGVQVLYVNDDPSEMEGAVLVESPKVNQMRGGPQRLELPNGRTFGFSIQQTLIADVGDDKTGHLKLVLALEEL